MRTRSLPNSHFRVSRRWVCLHIVLVVYTVCCALSMLCIGVVECCALAIGPGHSLGFGLTSSVACIGRCVQMMLAADSDKSDWLIDIIAIWDAMFRHAALCFAAITSLLSFDLCLVSSMERGSILVQRLITRGNWKGDCLQIFRVAPERQKDDLRCKKVGVGSRARGQKISILRITRHPLERCGWHWAALAYSLGQH